MQLTKEQKQIVDSVKNLDSHLVINAYAGTGKTTTLVAVAESYPQYKFLYLAYNRSVKEEAEARFPSNVKVLTTHGLGYKWYVTNVGSPRLGYNLRPYTICELYDIDYKSAYYAIKIFHEYCNSVNRDMHTIAKHMSYKVPSERDYINIGREAALRLWQDMIDRKIEITHDFYLKLASESDCSELLSGYDFVLLDEAQDTNPVVFKILLNSGKPIIAVGDVHQKIYGFRNAMDVMSKLYNEYDAKMLYLTESFRFPQEVADLAYQWLCLKPDFDEELYPPLKGQGPKDPKIETYAYITRTNAEIVDKIAKMDPNSDFYSYRTPSEIFALPMAIAERFFMYTPPIKLPDNLRKFVSKFYSLGELSRYALDANDIEVSASIDIVKMYHKRLTDLYKLLRSKNRKKKGLCILTAHTSKGLEFGTVKMADDWEWNIKPGTQQEIEEYNLIYVAMTRSIHTMYPNNIVKDRLNLKETFCISKKAISIDEVF